MENTQQQQFSLTQSTPSTEPPSSATLRLVTSRSGILSRSSSTEPNKTWFHLFRPSLLGPPSSQSQSQSPQPLDDRSLTTFTFCQNRLISSTEDLSKIIQNAYSTFSQDKEKLETLLGSARDLIQTIRNENITQNDENMNAS